MPTKKKKPLEGEKLEEIRSILFGTFFDELDQRIDTLEQRLNDEVQQLKEQQSGQFKQVMEEIKVLHDLIHTQSTEVNRQVNEQVSHLEEELQKTGNDLKISKVDRNELSALLTDIATYLAAGKA